MKKFLVTAAVAAVALTSLATTSEAHHRWRHGHWYGHAHGFVIDVGPRYVYDDAGYCFVKKIRKYNRWGELVVKRVTVCR